MTEDLTKGEFAAIGQAAILAKQPAKKSVNLLVGGLLLAFIGQAIAEVSRQDQISAALRGSRASSSAQGWGSILALAGVIVALYGLSRLASSIDRLTVMADATFALAARVEDLTATQVVPAPVAAPESPSAEPGWYEVSDGSRRYWDGTAWSEPEQ